MQAHNTVEQKFVFKLPCRPGSVWDMIRSGRFDAGVFPRGLGSVTEDEYYTAEDVQRSEKLQKLVAEGKLIAR